MVDISLVAKLPIDNLLSEQVSYWQTNIAHKFSIGMISEGAERNERRNGLCISNMNGVIDQFFNCWLI